MSFKLGNKIAEGGCSEVFQWENENKIIKLAKSNTDLNALRREYHNSSMAWKHGISVARPYEIVEIEGRLGIVFERVYGESLMVSSIQKLITQEESSSGEFEVSGSVITAQVLHEIHSKSNLNLPDQKEHIKYAIRQVDYLTAAEKEAVIDRLEQLPVKQQLCHGDPNPGNILIRDGKPVIIDWMDASIGNPEADIAEYIIMIRYAILPANVPIHAVEYFNSIRESMIAEFLNEYMRLSGITYEEIDPWITPIAARKLFADAVSEQEKDLLIREIRRRLQQQ